MDKNITSQKIMAVKNKIPELFYAITDNGVELPVLDITHPLFKASINEEKLPALLKELEINGEKNAEKFEKIPEFVKRYFAKHSFVMAELLSYNKQEKYLSGMSTLMLKLGPWLIGKGKNRFLDRLASRAFGGVVLRMRIRDLCYEQSAAALSLIKKDLNNNICFLNIAGGAASDSINSLLLIKKEHPDLLKGKKIEIIVLDIDAFGPNFAGRCIDILKGDGGPFKDLDMAFQHVFYDWNDTEKLKEILLKRKDRLIIFSSEGGIFEYCSEDIIFKHLLTLRGHASENACISGSFLRDPMTVDKGVIHSLRLSAKIKPNLLGISKFKDIVSRTGWKINSLLENNPRYIVFTLTVS